MQLILGLVALAIFVWLWMQFQKLVARGAGAIEGAVTGNSRKRGLEAVHVKLEFVAPIEAADLIGRLVSLLDLPREATYKPNLYLESISEDGTQIQIASGSKLGTALEYLVMAEPSEGGCKGVARVLRWKESNYLVTETHEIERLHKYVRSVAEQAGGTVIMTSSQD